MAMVMEIKRVGVVGAGVMGSGIAQSLAEAGFGVVLVDESEAIINRGRSEIRNGLRLARLMGKSGGTGAPSVSDLLKQIETTTDLGPLDGVDFLIETVTERWTIKEPLFRQLDKVCPEHCVFASNTSAISITQIGSATERPSQVLGIHFMNPVPLRPTVEVIRGFHTTDTSIEVAKGLLSRMGKKCVLVNDMPGFVSNRVLMLTINEAIFLVQDQVAEPEDIDRVFRECLGHTMGPLATADLIGLDTILYSLEVLLESYADNKYRPCPLLKKMVHAGLHGRKSKAGFFKYDDH